MLIASLEFIQNGMLNFAAAAVMGGIGASPEEFSYSAMAYATTAILMLFNHHWFSRRLGMRRFVRGSVVVFALGALLCATANSPALFVLGRAVQGLGGAVFFTAARVEINALHDRSRMSGLLCFGYALMLGAALGPLLGAQALRYLDWRWIFWGMLPWLVLALPATRLLQQQPEPALPAAHSSHALAWLVTAVLLGQWLIQQLPYDFFSRPQWLLLLLLACVATALLVIWLKSRQIAAADGWRPLAQVRYVLGLGFYFCCYLLVAANSYILPVMVQQALGFDVPTTGQLLSVSFIAGMAFATVYSALLLHRRAPGLRMMLLFACGLLALYGGLMAAVSPEVGVARLAGLLLLNGGFMSLFIMAVAQGTFRGVDAAHFARAYQSKNIIRQLAISMGVAGSTVFLQARNAQHYQRLAEGYSWHNPLFNDAMAQLQAALPQLGQAQQLAVLAGELGRQSMLLSCQDFFHAECVLAGLLMVLVLWQRQFD